MNKFIKRAIMLSACLLTVSAMWASVIGTATTAIDDAEVARACGNGGLKLYPCVTKNGMDSGCGNGTKESCVEIRPCPPSPSY